MFLFFIMILVFIIGLFIFINSVKDFYFCGLEMMFENNVRFVLWYFRIVFFIEIVFMLGIYFFIIKKICIIIILNVFKLVVSYFWFVIV